jgi:FAD:protein FMN transferase
VPECPAAAARPALLARCGLRRGPDYVARVARLRPGMGTWVAIEATAATEPVALAAVESAFAAIAVAERLFHPYRPGSDLLRINSAPPHTRVPIQPSTWRVLKLSQVVYGLSGGTFDPCLPMRPGRLCDLELSAPREKSTWALCRVPLALDLGGIAKGYAVDSAIEALRAGGCSSGLVNAGGDLRVHGRSADVLLRHADGRCTPVTLSDEALAVSDLDAQRRPAEHQGYYCRLGSRCGARRFAAVVAARAALADALTKCVLLAQQRCTACSLSLLGARLAVPVD